MSLSVFKKPIQQISPLMQKISENDISSLMQAQQVFSDCYILSSLHALAKSSFGRKILSQNIKKSANELPALYFADLPEAVSKHSSKFKTMNVDTFCITFNDVCGKKEEYCVAPLDLKKNMSIYVKQKNPVIRAMEIAMNRLVHRHFFKKPLISRMHFPFLHRSFEFNIPSNFMKMFTGIEPVSVGEKGINMTLKPYKKEVFKIFEKMSKNPKDFSFVAGTGFKTFNIDKGWHCFVVDFCDYENQRLSLVNKRTGYPFTVTFDEAINTLKFLTGYFKEKFIV